MDYQELFQKTVELQNAGKLDASRNLVIDYLRDDSQSIDALHLLTDLLEDPNDKQTVLDQILKINPKNRIAQEKIKQIQLETALNNAYGKAREGNIEEALLVVDRVITEDKKMPSAWFLKARYSNNSNDVNNALAELEKLSVSNEDAKLYLNKLVAQASKGGGKKRKIRTGYLFILAAIVIFVGGVCGLIITPLIFGNKEPTPTTTVFNDEVDTLAVEVIQTQALLSCQEIIEKAILLAEDVCSGLDSNQACYGNQTVFADFVPDYTGRFELAGDLVSIDKLTRIVASPLRFDEQLWGIAFLKLQANLPGTLPGQNVTFLVFGDTVLENNSQNMSTFYFTTGLTGISCEQVDYDGLFISMPDGSGIAFRSNGVDVNLQGDAILQAQPAGEMSVSMLSGSSELSTNGQTVMLNAGSYSTIPMSENLEPSGPISEPKPLSQELLELACQLLGVGCPGNPIPTVTFTSTPTLTITSTSTQIGPTATKTKTPTNTTTPTKTPTKSPTAIQPPTLTSTTRPTDTPTPCSCSDIAISSSGSGQYQITNNYCSNIIITRIDLTWPDVTNGAWEKALLAGRLIHSQKLSSSPATANLFANLDRRTIIAGISSALEFQFENPPAPSGYSVTVEFDVGCTISK